MNIFTFHTKMTHQIIFVLYANDMSMPKATTHNIYKCYQKNWNAVNV